MTHGVKGAKSSHTSGAKEHGKLVHHIENVAEARKRLNEAKSGHDEHVRELYKEHGGSPMDAMDTAMRA